jgi:tRNA1Val (adenine37-N6)-methyltransferase
MKTYEPFRFKRFSIEHQQSAMKVGTDAVLLGAWADFENQNQILDVGTGTGVIALMMAQRFEKSRIIAIDIEKEACKEAQLNVGSSPFSDRIDVLETDIMDYRPADKFDGIICNPPFFTNSLKSANTQRDLARHDDSLSAVQLIARCSELLNDKGSAAFILPSQSGDIFVDLAKRYDLYVQRLCRVSGNSTGPVKRILVQLGKQEIPKLREELVIEIGRHKYTEQYKNLVKDFYLAM